MKHKLRVGIFFGGRSGEHEVSLKSARAIINALDPEKYDIFQIGITKTGRWIGSGNPLAELTHRANAALLDSSCKQYIHNKKISGKTIKPDNSTLMPKDQILEPLDVVIPVLHGPYGEDGTIQGMLELANIPYVGCGVLASALAMDKIAFKQLLTAHQIPTPDFLPVNRKQFLDNPELWTDVIIQTLNLPVFCKPANLGSSVGITKCCDRKSLQNGLKYAARYDRRIIVEKSIENPREIEMSILGNDTPQVSVPGEIIPSRDFYDYEAKYIDVGERASKLIIPAKLNEDQVAECSRYAITAFKAIDGSGMSRVDFLMDSKTNKIFLNEINTIPGFTAISMYSKLWEASGIPYKELIDILIQLALEKFQDKQNNTIDYIPNS
ncbi:D-alanine--D-alanine ligase [bacterium]|nr:D-alanine--D-alanine ligase [candidate division CSSED10-310 bacterium]